MIRILKQGKTPAPTKIIYITSCPKCDCEFEFELEDCKAIERCLNGKLALDCPCCGYELNISRAKFTSREEEIREDKEEA